MNTENKVITLSIGDEFQLVIKYLLAKLPWPVNSK